MHKSDLFQSKHMFAKFYISAVFVRHLKQGMPNQNAYIIRITTQDIERRPPSPFSVYINIMEKITNFIYGCLS